MVFMGHETDGLNAVTTFAHDRAPFESALDFEATQRIQRSGIDLVNTFFFFFSKVNPAGERVNGYPFVVVILC